MITQDLGAAHPWLAALLGVAFFAATPLLLKVIWAAIDRGIAWQSAAFGGLAAVILGFAASVLWCLSPTYRYTECSIIPQCQHIVIGKIYRRS